MAKRKLVNTETNRDVNTFIDQLKPKRRQDDARYLCTLFKEITGCPAKIWGVSIFGFGKYTDQRKNGEEYEWFHAGFSINAKRIAIYIMYDINLEKELLLKLGPHTTGKGCLYIVKLSDIDLDILQLIVQKSDRWDR